MQLLSTEDADEPWVQYIRTIKTLDAMKVNTSDLFETLLQQYEPFLDTWAELGYGSHEEDNEE